MLPKARRRFKRTTLLTWALVWLLLGVAIARTGGQISVSWLMVGVVVLLITIRRKPFALLVSIAFMAFVLGWLRGQAFLSELRPYQDLYGQKIVLQVRAETDATYDDRGQLSFDGGQVTIIEPSQESVPGKIKIGGFGELSISRGDIVQVEGKIFPTLGARQGRISFAELKTVGVDTSFIETTRKRFVAGMQSALPEPLASFSVGLLVGQRNTLPERVTEALAVVGLTHIIAVSGYNLTIIMRAARRALGGRSKYQTAVISLALMSSFLLVTGFSASIVRAAIVSSLSLVAWYYGRRIKPLLILLLAAGLTATWNPLYLWSDLGWYLSFFAFFGVLMLAPLIVRRLYRQRSPKFIQMIIIESLCAQVMTAPLILWIFHQTSVIAPLSNLLIVPLVPFAMLLGLVAGVAGMFVPFIAGWFAWPARILLTYMIDVTYLFARVPNALVERTLTLIQMLLLYGTLLFVTLTLHIKTRSNRATITEKELVY